MFLPYKDDNPTDITPYVTIVLISLNVVVFFLQIFYIDDFGLKFAVVPNHIFTMESPDGYPHPIITLFTSMFLHGGLFHIIGNMLFLWIFGNNVEDTLGHVRFLAFYLFCGFMADGMHIAADFGSVIPSIGASGAISGMLGAYLLLYPYATITSLFLWFPFHRIVHMSAIYYIVFWFLMQMFNAYISSRGVGGVAWYAHIGGFGAGALIIFMTALIWPLKNNLEAYQYTHEVYESRKGRW